jgi:hydroxyjasmonate sulfotransferase
MRTFPSQAEQETNMETKTNHQELYQRYADSVSSLPSAEGLSHLQLYRHHQGWHGSQMCIAGAMAAGACFAARPSDILVATLPKSGTTWVKSLLYATVHRGEHPPDAADHPFNSFGPHECVKFLEYQIYTGKKVNVDDLDELPDPRLFATHVPFVALLAAVVASGCKIVYMCRDPKDTVVSLWHFTNRLRASQGLEPIPAETAAALFCDGMSAFGPFWERVLG